MRERSAPFNRDPVIVLSAGFALLSAQKPDQARSVLLQHSLGACAVPPVPAVKAFQGMAQRLRDCCVALASALHLEVLRARIGGALPDWPWSRLRFRPRAAAQPEVEPMRIPATLGPSSGFIIPLEEFQEFGEGELNDDVEAYWVPHAPTKGGRIMTGSA
jgi:hypothetical protein